MDQTRLTFSQAEGLEPIPGPLALGELSQELRASIWAAIYRSMQECRTMTSGVFPQQYLRDPWASILRRKHLYADHKPIDEFHVSYEHHEGEIKTLILAWPYNRVFDFLQHVLGDEGCPPGLAQLLQFEFTRSQAAYDIIEKTIVPRALKEEGDTLRAAFAALGAGQFAGAREHLISAAENLTKSNFADSVRESIHAVESVAKVISGDHAASLRSVLDSIAKTVPIHGAFKDGLNKIYGYASDEKGIRHSLLGEASKVDSPDAQFMLGACASFISYLIGKARASGLVQEKP